jgi:hypothetical protein
VSHARHQVPQTGIRLSGQRVPRMAQVVEMEVRQSDLLPGLSPADCPIEVSAVPRLPVLVDKHPPVRAVERVDVQVVLEFGQDGGRARDHADSGPRFRRS